MRSHHGCGHHALTPLGLGFPAAPGPTQFTCVVTRGVGRPLLGLAVEKTHLAFLFLNSEVLLGPLLPLVPGGCDPVAPCRASFLPVPQFLPPGHSRLSQATQRKGQLQPCPAAGGAFCVLELSVHPARAWVPGTVHVSAKLGLFSASRGCTASCLPLVPAPKPGWKRPDPSLSGCLPIKLCGSRAVRITRVSSFNPLSVSKQRLNCALEIQTPNSKAPGAWMEAQEGSRAG